MTNKLAANDNRQHQQQQINQTGKKNLQNFPRKKNSKGKIFTLEILWLTGFVDGRPFQSSKSFMMTFMIMLMIMIMLVIVVVVVYVKFYVFRVWEGSCSRELPICSKKCVGHHWNIFKVFLNCNVTLMQFRYFFFL